MNAPWPEVALGDVVADVTVGHVGPMASEYQPEGIPFLRSQNVVPFGLDLTDLKYVSPEFHARLAKSSLSAGDVVVVRTGRPGSAALIPDALGTANCSDLVVIRPGGLVDPQYLVSAINLANRRGRIGGLSVGSVQSHFNIGDARRLRVTLPPLGTQQTIAMILSSFDEKIRCNQTTAALSKRLALMILRADKHMHPADWRAGAISDLATLSKRTVDPRAELAALFAHFSLPAFDAEGWPTISTGDAIKSGKFSVPGDCVLVSKLNPRLPRVWLPDTAGLPQPIASTEWLVLVPTATCGAPLLAALVSEQAVLDDVARYAHGTTGSHQRVRPSEYLAIEIAVPNASACTRLRKLLDPMAQLSACSARESRALTATRNYLLPRLLEGRLRIRDAEKIAEVAI